MRCSAWSSLAISVCRGRTCPARPAPLRAYGSLGLVAFLAFMLVPTASAHVIAMPTYVASGSSQAVIFSGPNERGRPMTSFEVVVPVGLEIAHAHPVDGWTEEGTASTATWTGGSLAPGADIPFRVTLKATADPGMLQVKAEQRYSDGGIVSWPIAITILPPKTSPSQNLALAGVVGLLGVLIVVAVAMLAWRRRPLPPEASGDA
jgi:uncharacterized protein YcnI